MKKLLMLAILALVASLAMTLLPEASAQASTITICKHTIPTPDTTATSFTFTGANGWPPGPNSFDTLYPPNPFQLQDGQCRPFNITGHDQFNKFTETVPSGWVLVNIACTYTTSVVKIGTTGNPAFQPGDDTVSVDQNEPSVTCNFFNRRVHQAKCNLAITKTASPNPVASGQQVTFTLTVKNVGNGACQPGAFPGTAIHDPQPPGLTFGFPVNIAQTGGTANWQCSLSPGLDCATPDPIPPGYSATFTFAATVTAPAKSKIKNCATVSNQNDINLGNNQSCVMVHVKP